MSRINSGLLDQVRLGGLELQQQAWDATTGAAIANENARAAHTWSTDGFWRTTAKAAGEIFSLGYYDAGPRSGVSAIGNAINDNSLVAFKDLDVFDYREGMDTIGETGARDGAGRLSVNRDDLGLSMTAGLRRAARYLDRSESAFSPTEAQIALYGTDDSGQLFDARTLESLAGAGSEYELAVRRAVALREREVGIRRASFTPAANFAVSFAAGFTDPAMIASGQVAGRVGSAFGGLVSNTTLEVGGRQMILPGTASTVRNLATRGLIAGLENVGQSAVLNSLAGQEYNWHDAMRDMAFGATFSTAFGFHEAQTDAAAVRMATRRLKDATEILSAVNKGAQLTERGELYFQHVPGLTRTATAADLGAAELVSVTSMDHIETAGGGRSPLSWLVGRDVIADGIGSARVTSIELRTTGDGRVVQDVVADVGGRSVKIEASGVSIDRYSLLEPGSRVRLDDGTLGTVETLVSESTPVGEAVRVPRRGDADAVVRVLGDDGRRLDLKPDELLARGGAAVVRRGQVVFDPNSARRAVIAFGKAKDASTLVHEPGHVFRGTLRDIDGQLAERVNEHYGQTSDRWTVDAEERFARDFERYMSEGKAPTKELTGVFERFAAWLKDLWDAIGGNKAELTDLQREAFGKLLDADQTKPIAGELGGRFKAVRDQLRRVLGDNDASRSTEALMLANAKAWSRATGRSIDEYFSDVVAGFTSSMRNPFTAPIRALPGPRPIIAKGRPAGYVNAYIEGLVRHADLPARAQREAQLMGLADPELARAKWRAAIAEREQTRQAEARRDEQTAADTMKAAKEQDVRNRMAAVATSIDRDPSRSLFDNERVAQIQADVSIKARSWLFQNKSDAVHVNPAQRELLRYNRDGTITVNHTFVHMMPADRLAAFNTPLMHLEILRDAIDVGVRPDSPELANFIADYGFDKRDADLHALAVGRLFRSIDRRTQRGDAEPVGLAKGQPAKPRPQAVIEQTVNTLEPSESTPAMSFSRDAIEERILEAGKQLAPETAIEAAVSRVRAEDPHFDESQVSFAFQGEIPTEIREALEGEPKYVQDQFAGDVPRGRGADTMSQIGVDAMLQIAREGQSQTTRLFYSRDADGTLRWLRRSVLQSGERIRLIDQAKAAIAAVGDPNGALLAWMHDNPTVKTVRTLLKPQEVGTHALLQINGKQFEVRDTGEGWRELVGINGNEGVRIPFDGIDVVPADAGTFIQGNRWRGPKPAMDAAAEGAAVEPSPPEHVQISPEQDLPPMPITTGGGTLPLVDPSLSMLHMSEEAPFRTRPGDFDGTHELAQDALDLTDTINSEDANGAIPRGGVRGAGITGGKGERIGAMPRVDRVGRLKQLDHPLLNVITNAIFQDPNLDSAGRRGNASAEQFALLHMNTLIDGYTRRMHESVTKAATAAGIGRVNIFARKAFEQEFREQVGRLVRDPAATSAAIADPHLRAAVEETRKTLRAVGQLGKDNFVKNFDKFALDDNYLTRKWAFEKLHALQKRMNDAGTPGAVTDLFEQAVLDARPNLSRPEARILGEALMRKLFSYGKEAGIDRNGFAAGLTNREHLLRVLEEQGVAPATRQVIADKVAQDRANSGSLPVAKRRTLLNEKAAITTSTGERISIEDLLENDAMALVHHYGQQVISEAAMTQVRRQLGAKLGTEFTTDAAMMEFVGLDMRNAGYSKPEVESALHLIDSGIKRLRGVPLDESGFWTDMGWRVRQFASIAGNGAFGLPAMFELGHAITRLGVRATLSNIPVVWKAWSALRRGDVNDPALKSIVYTLGIGNDTINNRYFASFEQGLDPFHTKGQGRLAKLDELLAAGSRLSRTASGVPHITEFSRLLAANGVQHKMVQQALAGKAPAAKRLAWLGMDQARWDAVAAEIRTNHQKGPAGLVDVQLDNWKDLQAKHDYIEAVRSSVNTIVQEGGIGASHPWLETELGKLVFQFRQFGIMAYNRQALAQWQIGDSEAIGRGMAAAVPIGLMQYLATTFITGVGRDDRDEYWKKSTTPGRLAIAAFSRASFSSIGPVAYDSIAGTFGYPTLGGFRASGLESDPLLGNPTFAIYKAGREGIGGGLRSIVDPNYDFSDENVRGLRTVMPFSRLPGTSLFWNQILNATPAKSLQRVDETK